MAEILLVLGVVFVLLVILFLLLLYIVKRVNLLMKDSFIDKLTELDFLIEDKEKKLEELNDEVTKKQDDLRELEEKMNTLKNSENKQSKSEDVVLPKYADYEDGNLLSGYKVIKENFNFDAEKIIKSFISKIDKKNNGIYEKLLEIRKYFPYDVIYRISSYQPKEQLVIVLELLNDDEKKYIHDLLSTRKFNIKKFIDNLDERIVKENPEITIYVGDKKSNFNNLDPHIKTIYDEKITEGFKIVYKGIVYDYSI